MYRHFHHLSVHLPSKSSSIIYPAVLRDYCNVSKGRKKKVIKLVPSDVPESPDPPITPSDSISNTINQEVGPVSLIKGNLMKSSLSKDTVSPRKKQQVKSDNQDDTKTSTKKTKIKSTSGKLENIEPEKLSLLERYGNTIKMPGMKPLCVAKKTTKDTSKAKPASKTDEKSQGASTENIIKSTANFRDTIEITEKIPKIRSPSFRLEKMLDIPCEWASVTSSWTPSQDFLDSILKFSIRGVEKSTNIEGRSANHVNCFITANKNAAKVVPAVTTVLSKTMTPAQVYALKLWQDRLTKQLGEEGFQQHKTQILTRGKQFHETIQQYLHGESVENLNIEDLPLISGCWKSLVPVLNRIDGVIAVESEVLHPQLLYRGVIDCIVEIGGEPFIIEWKHSSRKKDSLQKNYDSPVQLMAYAGAINSNASYPFGVKNSLLVVAYEDGSPADVFLLSSIDNGDQHWNTWLKRLHAYWTLLKAERDLAN